VGAPCGLPEGLEMQCTGMIFFSFFLFSSLLLLMFLVTIDYKYDTAVTGQGGGKR
jgi:hypothetical protein